MVVAGYVARRSAWNDFSKKWQRALAPIKVFHSNECNGRHGEWDGWSKEDRDEKVKSLLPLLPGIKGVGLAVGIVLKDVEQALQAHPHLKPYWGNPYEACFHWWLSIILEQMHKRQSYEPLAIVHEENQYGDEARSAFNYIKKTFDPHDQLVGFSFGAKNKYVPLQAADILAYEVNKRLQNIEGNPRKSFDVLMRENFEPLIRFYDKQNLGPLISALEMSRTLDEAEALAPAFVRRPT